MIKPLAPEVRSRLRSGIATPTVAQCAEELVLNSIDAGATCVAVRTDIANYKIQVIDNGYGLNKDEMNIIGERYTTSKCHDLKDLDNLSFFGYRGEALASISNISGVLEIVSKKKGSDITYSKLFRNGKPLEPFESSKQRPSPGTTITVHNVFQNLPVRKKMLSPGLDYERVRKRIQGLALIQPKVSITLRDDSSGTVSIQTHCTSTISKTFGCLFGQEYTKTLKRVQCSNDKFTVEGYVGTEGHFNKKLQFLYVNKRLVTKTKLHKLANILLGRSLIGKRKVASDGKESHQNKDGPYSDLSSPGRSQDLYGMFVLNIDCSLVDYDITLDPGKTLVEFKNWTSVLQCLEELINNFLKKENLTMKLDKPSTVSAIEEVGCSEVVGEDSQEDEIEALSGMAKDRIADLSEKYGRGIHTSNCSNTLMGLIVRRGAVQNCIDGSANIQAGSPDLDDSNVESPEVYKIPEKLSQESCNNVTGDSSESVLANKSQPVVGSNAAEEEVVKVSPDSEASSLQVDQVIPETPITSDSDTVKKTLHLSNSAYSNVSNQLSPVTKDTASADTEKQGSAGSIGTPEDKPTSTTCNNVIEISSDTKSEHSSSESVLTPETIDYDDHDVTSHKRRKVLHNTPVKESISRTIENNSSEMSASSVTSTAPVMEAGNVMGCSSGRPSERVSEFISDIYKTPPVGYHPPAPTRKIGLTRAVSSLGAFRYKKASSSSLKTANDTEAVAEQDASSDMSNYSYRSSLYTFRQFMKQRNSAKEKCVQSNEGKDRQAPVSEECSNTSTSQHLSQEDELQLKNTMREKDPVEHIVPFETGVSTPSSALLSKERNIPQLGSEVNKETSLHFSSSNQTCNQNKQDRNNPCDSILQHQNKDYNREQLAVHHTDNVGYGNTCTSVSGYSKQMEADFDRHWEDINIFRSDPNRLDPYDRCKQKPNLKRLRNQFNAHNTTQSSGIIERRGREIPPEKRFLTSESFLVSAQDLLGVKPQPSNTEALPTSSPNKDTTSHSNEHKSNVGDGIWSAIENDCREFNRTMKPSSPTISESDSHIEEGRYPTAESAPRNTSHQDIYLLNAPDNFDLNKRYQYDDMDHCRIRHSYHNEQMPVRCNEKSTRIYNEDIESDNQTASVSNQQTSRIEVSLPNSSNIDSSLEIQANLDVRDQDFMKEQMNSLDCTTHKQTSASEETMIKHKEDCIDQTCISPSNSLASSAVSFASSDIQISNHRIQQMSTGIVVQSSSYQEEINVHTIEDDDIKVIEVVDKTPPCQSTQSFSPGSRDVLVEGSSSTSETDDGPSAIVQRNYSTDRTPPVQNTQRFSPCSSDILVEGSSPSCPSDMDIDKATELLQGNHFPADSTSHRFSPNSRHVEGETLSYESGLEHKRNDFTNVIRSANQNPPIHTIDQNQKLNISHDVNLGTHQTEIVRQNTESDITTTIVGNTTKSLTPGNSSCSNEPSESHVLAGESSDHLANVDAVQKHALNLSEEAKNIDAATEKPVATKDDTEDRNLVNMSTESGWFAQYDAKKQQTVYINIQTGNCTLEKPDCSELQGDCERRKDFIDGATTSSSVNACMTSTGQSHPLLTHNATPFLPRNKKQRLSCGGVKQSVVSKEPTSTESTCVTVDNLVNQHLEKEDQDIANKWRDDDKENVAQEPDKGGDEDSIVGLLSSWSSHTSYGSIESNILDIRSNQISANAARVHGTLHPYKFTKAMFENIKVIGQVDNKFIACMVNTEAESPSEPNLLILIDQHAAHERVRLEQLTADAYEKDTSFDDSDDSEDYSPPAIKSSSVLPPVQLTLSTQDVHLLGLFKSKLERLGVGICATNEEPKGGCRVVEITHLPACMVEREAHELKRGRQSVAITLVETLIKEQLDLLQDTSGASAVLPKTITKLLNSQACHGAIKFGDKLSKDECLTLVGQLSQCDLPFQCAHGRPSLIPVLDIKLLKSKLTLNEIGTPHLWKLKANNAKR